MRLCGSWFETRTYHPFQFRYTEFGLETEFFEAEPREPVSRFQFRYTEFGLETVWVLDELYKTKLFQFRYTEFGLETVS